MSSRIGPFMDQDGALFAGTITEAGGSTDVIWMRSTDSGESWQVIPEDDPVLQMIELDLNSGLFRITYS